MTYIDFHAHMDYKDFDIDRDKISLEMKDKNIVAYSNTLSRKNYEETVKQMEVFENIKVCPGLYPQEAEEITDEDFNNYLIFLRRNKDNFDVIGEVGLDFYHTKIKDGMSDDEIFDIERRWKSQELRFRDLIKLGIELDKPLCIHTRGAELKVLEILEEYVNKFKFRKFNLHCFSGKKKLISKIKELNIYCSIPLTILNTQSFEILVKELSIKQLLVETDSPFLNPKKIRNSPLNVPLIYDKIAEIKGLNKKEIVSIIYMNFQSLVYL